MNELQDQIEGFSQWTSGKRKEREDGGRREGSQECESLGTKIAEGGQWNWNHCPLFKKEKVHRLEKQNKNKKEGMAGKPKDSSEIKPAPYKGNTVRPSEVKGNPATLESQAALCCGNMTLDTGSSDARF